MLGNLINICYFDASERDVDKNMNCAHHVFLNVLRYCRLLLLLGQNESYSTIFRNNAL